MTNTSLPAGLELEADEHAIMTLRPGPTWTLMVAYIFTLGLAYWALKAKTLTLTDRRVIQRGGVLTKHQRVVPVSMVQDVNVQTTWYGTGIVALTTAGGAMSLEAFNAGAAEAKDFGAEVLRAAHIQRHGQRAPVLDTPSGDGIAKLRELAQLRDEGVISSEEFEAKKTDLLRVL